MLQEEEEFSSDSSDEDYVPFELGEAASEEEDSGEEEGPEGGSAQEGKKNIARGKKRKKKEPADFGRKKRSGGIRLEDDEVEEEDANDDGAEDNYNEILAAEVEQEKIEKKKEEEKNHADSLWADFMKDVGGPKKTKNKPTFPETNKASCSKTETKTTSKNKSNGPAIGQKKVVTKEYQFAGETIKVTEEVSEKAAKAEPKKPAGPLKGLQMKMSGGLGSVLNKINKPPTMSTLNKSKLDWESFKNDHGISEELQIHNRGKASFLERKAFLERTDVREYEQERDIRLKSSSSNR